MTTDALNHCEKHPDAIYRDIFSCNNENFVRKRLDSLNIFAQNIDCIEYQQSCVHGIKNNNNNKMVSQFRYIKLGFKVVFITRTSNFILMNEKTISMISLVIFNWLPIFSSFTVSFLNCVLNLCERSLRGAVVVSLAL